MSQDPVELLIEHIKATIGPGPFEAAPGWTHMGAVISDAVLQRRMDYCAVYRRVKRLQEQWPQAATVSGFKGRIEAGGLEDVLEMRQGVKLATIRALCDLLASVGVENREDLCSWLDEPGNRRTLLKVKWVGPKTLAYLGNLVGRSEIAIDTRLCRFAGHAGVHERNLAALKGYYALAADRLGCDRGGLDHAVWRYMGKGGGSSPC